MVPTNEPEFQIAARDFGADALDRLPVYDDRDRPVFNGRSHGVHIRGAGLDEVICRGLPNREILTIGLLPELGLAVGMNGR